MGFESSCLQRRISLTNPDKTGYSADIFDKQRPETIVLLLCRGTALFSNLCEFYIMSPDFQCEILKINFSHKITPRSKGTPEVSFTKPVVRVVM